METTASELQKRAARLLQFVEQEDLFSLGAEAKRALRIEIDRLLEKLEAVNSDLLTIGLLGGTGVGKSTILNALAGAKIASTSHRRPHTDRVLLYRHRDAVVPANILRSDIPYQEFVHEVASVRHVLLCDLPDFDSLLGEHREQVRQFLEHLDIMVWVTSLEKYADRKFYDFLRQVPKARKNFCFVLNKADLLFSGRTIEQGYNQLTTVVRNFTNHLGLCEIEKPLLFPVSAQATLTETTIAPWNQFPSLRHHIFRQRDIKEITAIKSANLDVELDQLLGTVRNELLQLGQFRDILEQALETLNIHREEWTNAAENTVDIWLDEKVSRFITIRLENPRWLIGLGQVLASTIQYWDRRMQEGLYSQGHPEQFKPPAQVTAAIRRHLEWLQNHIDHQVLRHNLPESFKTPVRELIRLSDRTVELPERLASVFHSLVEEAKGTRRRGFRFVQWFSYGLLLALLLIAIGSQTPWQLLWRQPSFTTFVTWIFSFVRILFGVAGIAALGTYCLLNILLAFRFYRRYKMMLRRQVDELKRSFKAQLLLAWNEQWNELVTDIEQLRDAVNRRIQLLGTIDQRG